MSVVDHAEMLEVLLAYTATWQTLTGQGTPTLARNYVYQYEADDTTNYPRATVMRDRQHRETDGFNQTKGGGTLGLRIDLKAANTLTTRKLRDAWFNQQIQTLIKEMLALSVGQTTPSGYSVTHLVVKRITSECQFEQDREDQPADVVDWIWTAMLLIEW
jgi:hypothetical protein